MGEHLLLRSVTVEITETKSILFEGAKKLYSIQKHMKRITMYTVCHIWMEKKHPTLGMMPNKIT